MFNNLLLREYFMHDVNPSLVDSQRLIFRGDFFWYF